MKFNIEELKSLLISIRANNLQYISVKQSNFELIINKEVVSLPSLPNTQMSVPTHIKPQISKKISFRQKSVEEPIKKKKIVESEIYFTIVSPMVGTFYRSPAPNEPHFIELNESVNINQTVCLVEAMKLMNEIEAEVSGEIVEILVKDGDIIDCGQALMKIKPEK